MGDYIRNSDPLYLKPARDLTFTEAATLLGNLQDLGDISVPDLKQGTMTATRQIRLSTKIAGVQFKQAIEKNHGAFGSVGATVRPEFTPTPVFAVVLYKLAVMLKDTWKVTEFVWGGIGSAGGGKSDDCHQNGRCVDFYGAAIDKDNNFDVRRDWFRRGVYQKFGRNIGKPHDRSYDSDDHWNVDTATYYRLSNNTDTEKLVGDKNYFNPNAADFFANVYELVYAQCTVGSSDITPEKFKSGELLKAGWTIHPDYPTFKRRPHNDHMHFQIGTT